VALRILDVGHFIAVAGAQLRIFDRHGAIDAERMPGGIRDVVRQRSERKCVLVDIVRVAKQLFDEIAGPCVVQQVGEEVAAEGVVPHVGHHGAAVCVGARLVDRIGVCGRKARLQQRDDDGVPGGIDERFVSENGVRKCRARQEQRPSEDQRGGSP
jgi:hypothetical protein